VTLQLDGQEGEGPVARPAHTRNLILHFVALASGFWKGPTRRTAYSLTFAFVVGLLANMLLAFEVNRWSKYFFDALQERDLGSIRWSLVLIVALAASSAVASAALVQVRMRLQLRWHAWLTGTLISHWLRDERMFHLSSMSQIDNPEARIADDGRIATELFVDLSGGILNTLLLSSTFLIVLWQVGGAMSFGGVYVPGYLVVAVILYSAVTSLGMYALGWPLVRRVEEKAAGEGDFRYALTRTREAAEEHALDGHDGSARRMLENSFAILAQRWIAVIGRQSRMALLSGASSVLAPVVPLLLGAPKFLSGEMTLGDLMQATAAFWQVHVALNWLADNALSLANWSASTRRIAALATAYEDLRK
jgi:vitamin B12/bleomycin/antimicrobial peptide transport system ATP-binding/permease protein